MNLGDRLTLRTMVPDEVGMRTNYSAPVAKLLGLGDSHGEPEWPNYRELGVNGEHIPELIRLATDVALYWSESEGPDVWGPVHAWRALGQLRAAAAIEPLLPLFHELIDSDWASEELPEVYGLIGPSALPALARYVAEPSHGLWPRLAAAHGLERIAVHHPTARPNCVATLRNQLEQFPTNEPEVNGFLISYLVDLKAIEAAPLIERAFAADRVDLSIVGDWEDAQVALGLRAARETPRPRYHHFQPPLMPPITAPKEKSSAEKAAAKAKAKRKQAKASRKKNKQRK